MYLVHLTITTAGDIALPAEIKQMLATTAPDALEHVSLHLQARPHPVISLFLRTASLQEAETMARQIWERAVDAIPQMSEWSLLRAEVPLIPCEDVE
ncbi:hypothetical protein CDG81_13660 [Actinopolyspora erythraea]|uniref:Uncharacterized protein n=1 Tax=Actinopolyspora erythraea TaxID=414996 RepID=A0A099D3N4_9ACTN|nr:hypothetical protein CDG81_13660 [Actinopolyspora erythraea]KGI80659.1 hypothetical protein IL38_16155 [Actinopolyspora erythraea]